MQLIGWQIRYKTFCNLSKKSRPAVNLLLLHFYK